MKKWLSILLIGCSCNTIKPVTMPLNGSKSFDKDGFIVKWVWRQITFNDAIIVNPSLPVTTAILKQRGEYKFELLVMDNDGLIDRDTTIKKVK